MHVAGGGTAETLRILNSLSRTASALPDDIAEALMEVSEFLFYFSLGLLPVDKCPIISTVAFPDIFSTRLGVALGHAYL